MTREITNAVLNHTITEELNTDCIYKQCILINSNFISAERKDRDSSRHGTDHDTEQLSTRDSSRHGTAHDTGQLTSRDSSRHGTAHDTQHGTRARDMGQVATRDRWRHGIGHDTLKKKKREKKAYSPASRPLTFHSSVLFYPDYPRHHLCLGRNTCVLMCSYPDPLFATPSGSES